MKLFFQPRDAYAAVRRAWESAITASDGEAVAFYREGTACWRGLRAPWSVKFVLDGEIDLELPNQQVRLEPGSCLVVAGDTPYDARVRNARYVSLFGRRLFEQLFGPGTPPLEAYGKFYLAKANLDALERFAAVGKDLEDAAEEGGTAIPLAHLPLAAAIPGALLQLQRRIDDFLAGRPRRLSLARRLLEARLALDTGFTEPAACRMAAERACLTRSQFSRQFSALFGISPRDHVNEVRTQAALHRLRRGEVPVAEVARALGYRHPSSLSHFFQRHDLPPPREFANAS